MMKNQKRKRTQEKMSSHNELRKTMNHPLAKYSTGSNGSKTNKI
jgi:hypothetical protein